jgi:hypothetical protein
MGGQRCDPRDAKAQPNGCVLAVDMVKCPLNAVPYGTECVCKEGFQFNADKTECKKKAGSEGCTILYECPGAGNDYCDGTRSVKRWECGQKFGCRRLTIQDCKADETCIGDRCMKQKPKDDGGCSTDADCKLQGKRTCEGESVVYYHCTSAGCLRQEAADCSVSLGSHCYDGACNQGGSGCRVDGLCSPELGDSCSGCPLCGCGDWACKAGDPNANSIGCVDPCLGMENTKVDKESGGCICKKGFKPSSTKGFCIPEVLRVGFEGVYDGFPMVVKKDAKTERIYMSFQNGDRTYLDKNNEPTSYSNDYFEALKQADQVPEAWEGYKASPAVIRLRWEQIGGATARLMEIGDIIASRMGGALTKVKSDATIEITTPTGVYKVDRSNVEGLLKLQEGFYSNQIISVVGRFDDAKLGTDEEEIERLIVADQTQEAAGILQGGRNLDVISKAAEAGWQVAQEAPKVATDAESGWPQTEPAQVPRKVRVSEEAAYGKYNPDNVAYDPNDYVGTTALPKDYSEFQGADIPFASRKNLAAKFLYEYGSRQDSYGKEYKLTYVDDKGEDVSVSTGDTGRLAWKYEETKDGKNARFVLWSVKDNKPHKDLALYVVDQGGWFSKSRVVLGSKSHPSVMYNRGREYGL